MDSSQSTSAKAAINEDSLVNISETFAKISLDKPALSIIDTVSAVSAMMDDLKELPSSPPPLYIDLEGINLSRQGSVSILQIFSLPKEHTYLVDVHTLGVNAFSTAGKDGVTLKGILESESITKVFFDVRNDSDALYGKFKIYLRGIEDLQLMELATRTYSRRFVTGLSKCIEKDAPLSMIEKLDWLCTKGDGVRLFAPEKGGSYEVFNERPLTNAIISYCANDVKILPRLWRHYNGKMGKTWRKKVLLESVERVKLSHSKDFCGKGQHMAKAPRGW